MADFFPSVATAKVGDMRPRNAPQTFRWAGFNLVGNLVSFSGQSPQRRVVHEFVKRRGAVVEDMEAGPRRVEVRLVFQGTDCAFNYQTFKGGVSDNPFGLLVHPIAGQFQAFCEGPQEGLDFARSTDEIQVTVAWIESQLTATVTTDVLDVPTSSQVVVAQQAQTAQDTATFATDLAAAATAEHQTLSKIYAIAGQISTATEPVSFARDVLAGVLGLRSAVYQSVVSVAIAWESLSADVDAYLAAATDVFNGATDLAGQANSVATLLGVVQTDGQALIDAMVAGALSPAGAADSVGSVSDLVASCLALQEAVQAVRPAPIRIVVGELTDVVTLAQQRYGTDALARASEILALNNIPNPAAIPSGTVLLVPSP